MGDDVRDCVSCGRGRDYSGDGELACESAKRVKVERADWGVSEVLKEVRESSLDGFVCIREFDN